MPCAAPLAAWKPAAGGPLKFNKPNNGRAYSPIEIPCGQCILCRLEHARQWAVRITHEATLHATSCFITLTYADEHLPEHNSLNYPDLQKFWKRLRHEVGPLRYYAAGEYGDNTKRPHYHACLFGHDFTADRRMLRQTPTYLWTSPLLEECWGLGQVSVGALTFETAQYTASYVTKKLNNKQKYVRIDEETGELIPVTQPRAFCSLKPAIARQWLNTYGKAVYDHDHVVINGTPQKPPKYYDKWLKDSNPTKEEQVKEKRQLQATKLSPEQNRARATNAHARHKQKTKTV